MLDKHFLFDRELQDTKVYKGQVRSLVRRSLRKRKTSERMNGQAQMSSQNSLSTRRRTTIHLEAIDDPNERKFLLLGPLDSGKTTLRRTMQSLHEARYTLAERRSYKKKIFATIYEAMRETLTKMADLALPTEDPDNISYGETLLTQPMPTNLDHLPPAWADMFTNLWRDEAVRQCFHEFVFRRSGDSWY